jgi:hypothetical protein
MNKSVKLLVPVLLMVAAPAWAGYTFNPVLDAGNTDSAPNTTDTWSFICEIGQYQAWFGFDISAYPDGLPIQSITFTARIDDYETDPVERTLWYASDDSWIPANVNPWNAAADEMVGSLVNVDGPVWETFTLDLSQHDWSNDVADNYVTLMLTGPSSGLHECGGVDLTESGYLPVLTMTPVPEPASLAVWGFLAAMAITVGWWRRRRRAT